MGNYRTNLGNLGGGLGGASATGSNSDVTSVCSCTCYAHRRPNNNAVYRKTLQAAAAAAARYGIAGGVEALYR